MAEAGVAGGAVVSMVGRGGAWGGLGRAGSNRQDLIWILLRWEYS